MGEIANLPKLYTEQEVAGYLGCAVATLAGKRRAGKIAFTRASGRVRYTAAQIEDYLEATTCPAIPSANSRSANTGSDDDEKVPPGNDAGTTEAAQDIHRLAQETFTKPRLASSNGTSENGAPETPSQSR